MYEYKGVAVRAVDGDTLHANIDLGFNVHYEAIIRLADYNACEMKSKDPDERRKAQDAKKELEKWSMGKDLVIQTHGKDKYGRYIAKIIAGGSDLNGIMQVFCGAQK